MTKYIGIFEKLKINIKGLKDSSKVFPFCTNFMQSTEYLNENFHRIFDSSKLNI